MGLNTFPDHLHQSLGIIGKSQGPIKAFTAALAQSFHDLRQVCAFRPSSILRDPSLVWLGLTTMGLKLYWCWWIACGYWVVLEVLDSMSCFSRCFRLVGMYIPLYQWMWCYWICILYPLYWWIGTDTPLTCYKHWWINDIPWIPPRQSFMRCAGFCIFNSAFLWRQYWIGSMAPAVNPENDTCGTVKQINGHGSKSRCLKPQTGPISQGAHFVWQLVGLHEHAGHIVGPLNGQRAEGSIAMTSSLCHRTP